MKKLILFLLMPMALWGQDCYTAQGEFRLIADCLTPGNTVTAFYTGESYHCDKDKSYALIWREKGSMTWDQSRQWTDDFHWLVPDFEDTLELRFCIFFGEYIVVDGELRFDWNPEEDQVFEGPVFEKIKCEEDCGGFTVQHDTIYLTAPLDSCEAENEKLIINNDSLIALLDSIWLANDSLIAVIDSIELIEQDTIYRTDTLYKETLFVDTCGVDFEKNCNCNFKIMPNPTDGQFSIHWSLPEFQTGSVTIRNKQGRRFYTEVLDNNLRDYTTFFDVDYEPGVYFITLEIGVDGEEYFLTRKIVIQ